MIDYPAAGKIRWIVALLFLLVPCVACAQDVALDRWRNGDPQVQAVALRLARSAFDAYATRRDIVEPPISLPLLLRQRVGIFVSAMRNGTPRCCMGTLYPTEPDAAREIIANAVAAAGRDRRFPPVKPGELKGLILIVSIVGRPRPISFSEVTALDPTRDGLAIKAGDRYGVVLSGETSTVDRMVQWGRIRAGAGPSTPVTYFRLDVVRFLEKRQVQ